MMSTSPSDGCRFTRNPPNYFKIFIFVTFLSTTTSFLGNQVKLASDPIISTVLNNHGRKATAIDSDLPLHIRTNEMSPDRRRSTPLHWIEKINCLLHNFNSEYITKLYHRLTKSAAVALIILPMLLVGSHPSFGDDELAKYAAEGNAVGVDGNCFLKKCSLETVSCGNDPSCLKGLSCLARCKGASMCSTGCFAKFGGQALDELLYCSVEKNDCVQVPGKENVGWNTDAPDDLPSKPISPYNIASLKGTWYKVMGLDSRYDCFDCQKNSFEIKDEKTLSMEALFRIPRPNFPGYLQNRIKEDLHKTDTPNSLVTLQSEGKMFGLTFWENWYVLGDSAITDPNLFGEKSKLANANKLILPFGAQRAFAQSESTSDLKLIYYTGHTLQGSYRGAFLYSRYPTLSPREMSTAVTVIENAGLNPGDFCIIRNKCFLSGKDCSKAGPNGIGGLGLVDSSSCSSSDDDSKSRLDDQTSDDQSPFWYLGQRFFQATKSVAEELADWFEDPDILSEWLVQQQERMVFSQPLAVSPFAAFEIDYPARQKSK